MHSLRIISGLAKIDQLLIEEALVEAFTVKQFPINRKVCIRLIDFSIERIET